MVGWRFWRRRPVRESYLQADERRTQELRDYLYEHPSYRIAGTRLDGGSDKPSASTGTKEPGTPTRATATTEGCSSYSVPGAVSADGHVLTWLRPASNSTVPGTFTFVTGGRGVSGAPQGSAD